MLVIGHRGAPAYEPENTLSSFALALELGADMLEFDVFTLPTGEAVIFHDRYLDRTTDGTGLLLHHSFRELRRLDAGHGQKIPTLQEVLDLVERRAPLVVELKTPGSAAVVAQILDEYIHNRGWRPEQFVVASFDHRELQLFKTQYAPHIPIAASTASIHTDLAAFAERMGAMAIMPDMNCINRELVQDAHERGLRVFSFVIATYEHTQELLALGADAVFSDAPDVSLQAIQAGLAAGIRLHEV